MTRFTASTLDLASLDPATVIAPPVFASIKAERLAELKQQLNAAGIAFDVDALETDPDVILNRIASGREHLVRNAVRDATLSVLFAFAQSLMLDRLGDHHGVARLALVSDPRPYAEAPEDWESDDRYRLRVQLAPEAFASTGTSGGYAFHAKDASADVDQVGIKVLRPRTDDELVEITILAHGDSGEPTEDLIETVRARLFDDAIKLLTDALSVRGARAVDYTVKATLLIPRGPDPGVIKAAAIASVQTMAAKYRRLGAGVPHSAIVAALHVPGVDSVAQVMPAGDISTLRFQFGRLVGVDVATEVIGG